jgi:hypothetical protein
VVVRAEEDEYWTYAIEMFCYARQQGYEARRLVFPSHAQHERISVTKLEDGLATDEAAKFSSYIIAPLAVSDLYTWLEAGQDNLPDKWLEDNQRLCEHIYEYPLASEIRKRSQPIVSRLIKSGYEAFLAEFRKRYLQR